MLVSCGLTLTGASEEEDRAPRDDAAAPRGTTTSADGAGTVGGGSGDVDDDSDTGTRDASIGARDAAIDTGRPDTGPSSPSYVITSDGGTWTEHPLGSSRPCSDASDVPATVVFRNQSPSTVHHYWVNFDCNEVFYEPPIEPGASATRSSYATHRWRIRRASDDAILLDFTPNGRGTYVVTIH